MKIEIRENSVDISGYVNVALRDSKRLPSNRGIFVEQIEPTVFQRALERNDDVKLLFNHKEDRQLGSQKKGNLTLHEDAIGLFAKCKISDPEVIEKARNQELRGWSFGFVSRKDDWDTTNSPQRRFVKDLDLLEVSVLSVTPAYSAMSIEVRDEETVIVEQRFEKFENRTVNPDDPEDEEDEKEEQDGDDEAPADDLDNDGDEYDDYDHDGDKKGNRIVAKKNKKKRKSSENRMIFLREKEIEIIKLRGVN